MKINKRLVIISGFTTALLVGGIAYQASVFPIDQVTASGSEKSDGDGEQSDSVEKANLEKKAKISQQSAEEIASKKVTGKVTESELEEENDKVVYSVSIKNDKVEKEVKVDAETGNVLKVETDDDQKNEKDDDQNEGNDEGEQSDK